LLTGASSSTGSAFRAANIYSAIARSFTVAGVALSGAKLHP
jgi:hypothetical protein